MTSLAFKNTVISALLCCCSSFVGEAATLVHYGATPGVYDATSGLAVGWQQSSSASNVTVSATLGAYEITTSPKSVTAYLTSTLGPATTVADLISTSSVSVAPYSGKPANYTLFSGLDLQPGTYYLTLSLSNEIGWLSSTTASLFQAPGFSYTGAFSVNGAVGAINPYTPSSDFYPIIDSASPASYGLLFDVSNSSSAVPEPKVIGITAVGIVILCLFRIKKRWCA